MIPNWSNIAKSVKSIQPILRPTVLLQDHTTDSQTSRATTGMRKNSDQTNVLGRLIWNLLARSNSRKKAAGLRNAANHTTTLNQTGRLRRGFGGSFMALGFFTASGTPARFYGVRVIKAWTANRAQSGWSRSSTGGRSSPPCKAARLPRSGSSVAGRSGPASRPASLSLPAWRQAQRWNLNSNS
jgi:hypothetical protein